MYPVTETDGSQTISVCVVAETPVSNNGIEATIISFEFIGQATGTQ